MRHGCIGDCAGQAPPDMILSMPPPPLPTFLIPTSAIVALSANDTQPCFAAYICEPNMRPGDHNIGLIELNGKSNFFLENTWVLIIITSCIGVILLGTILAFILIKCRKYNYSYQETNLKQSNIPALGESSKANPFISGGMLYPCSSNRDALEQQLATDNRLLWATLTPQGQTRHFVTDYPLQDDNYDVIDCTAKTNRVGRPDNVVRRTPIRTFDNNGFIDYDNYEDPTPLMDSYHDDLDSGYQEPQEVIGNTISRNSPRLLVSSPTHIENPNLIMPPLNLHPNIGTLRKSTLHRTNNDISYN